MSLSPDDVSPDLPNNVGPTILIVTGAATLPFGVGLFLLLVGLASLRDLGGTISFPQLRDLILLDQIVQFWRRIKL